MLLWLACFAYPASLAFLVISSIKLHFQDSRSQGRGHRDGYKRTDHNNIFNLCYFGSFSLLNAVGGGDLMACDLWPLYFSLEGWYARFCRLTEYYVKWIITVHPAYHPSRWEIQENGHASTAWSVYGVGDGVASNHRTIWQITANVWF